MLKSNIEETLLWARQCFAMTCQAEVNQVQQVAQSAYSVVHKFDTANGPFYLKQVPEILFQTPKVLSFLRGLACSNVPNVVASNDDLHCFIMASCGDESLRHLFKDKIDLSLLELGIRNYTNIQRCSEDNIQQMLKLGIPDWRLENFTSLYASLIEKRSLLRDDGLSEAEIVQLQQLVPMCADLCEKLSDYKIPETIVHCDFHDNNMLLDRKTNTVNIIDWGESVISHPFFSSNSCLWNFTYFNNLKRDDSLYKKIEEFCIAAWQDFDTERHLLEVLCLCRKIHGIFSALTYERLYVATKDQPVTVQQEHPGSIAGCLRNFLSSALD